MFEGCPDDTVYGVCQEGSQGREIRNYFVITDNLLGFTAIIATCSAIANQVKGFWQKY